MAGTSQAFVNGNVFTGQGEDAFANAFTIADGRVTWVGDAADIDATGAIDLKGRTVLPGLLDVHCHPSHVARIVDAVACTVPTVTDIPSMVAALKTHRNAGAGPDAWIDGWGYDESKLAERRTRLVVGALALERAELCAPLFKRGDVFADGSQKKIEIVGLGGKRLFGEGYQAADIRPFARDHRQASSELPNSLAVGPSSERSSAAGTPVAREISPISSLSSRSPGVRRIMYLRATR